jgi:hypothetical protein
MLRKQAWPVLPSSFDADAISRSEARARCRLHQPDRSGDLLIEVRVFLIVDDRQGVHTTLGGDYVTVAEVPTKQQRVCLLVEIGAIASRTGCGPEGIPARQALSLVEPTPPANGLDRDTMDLGVRPIALTPLLDIRRAESTVSCARI